MKRRAFDSVDPTFDNAVPSKGEGKDNFFKVFSPVFERNARWSSKRPGPSLGSLESSFEEVDSFYSFWWVKMFSLLFGGWDVNLEFGEASVEINVKVRFRCWSFLLLKVQLWLLEGILLPGWRGKGKSRMVRCSLLVLLIVWDSCRTTENVLPLLKPSTAALPLTAILALLWYGVL